MADALHVVGIQADLIWEKPKRNLVVFEEKIKSLPKTTDLVVLAEMFTTGFTMKPKNVAEEMNGHAVSWMQKMAIKNKLAICGSLVISNNKKFYNRFIFVHPTGTIEIYDKRHSFTLAGEDKVYTSGYKKLIINYKGWKICPLICYDLRFPVWARNTENYDVLCYVANWPEKRIAAWDTLLKARSIENMCYVVGVNRVGADANNFAYNGHSAAFDSLGTEIVKTVPNKDETRIVTLDKNHLNEIRTRLNFLNDKDSFHIN